jgi:hypothetical protein
MAPVPRLSLGNTLSLNGGGGPTPLLLPAHHLVTHGVIVGMTGSGKTGLLTVLVEETLRARVPVLMIDVKGDLADLLLAFPSFDPRAFVPWVKDAAAPEDDRSPEEIARSIAATREHALRAWTIGEPDLRAFRDTTAIRVITPGSSAGEPLHVLSSLERRSARWDTDPEAARAALAAAVSLVLRLLGRDPDPARSREHVLLSVLAERRLRGGEPAAIPALLEDLASPPVERIGALTMDAFLPRSERRALAAALNGLLASPSFESWRTGAPVDVESWLTPSNGRTPAVILSVAHLDDEERALVLGVLLQELLAWTRSLPGSQRLRALCVFDEVYGFLPPHPANPPTKQPLVSLMKQARAFGVGVVLATQNPMDLDYRALGNAGLWCLGRLQTDADRARVVEGMAGKDTAVARMIGAAVQRLAPQWFVMRDVHDGGGPVLFQPRCAMSWLRGPLTRVELRRLREEAPEGPKGMDTAQTSLSL